MTGLRIGLAVENYTPHKQPDIHEIDSYARKAEALGFDSLWVWDRILLGSKQATFALSRSARWRVWRWSPRRTRLGTGILVLPCGTP
ncbi:MAG: hypothetical protein U0V56_12290 [Actinomycetota bacterium]